MGGLIPAACLDAAQRAEQLLRRDRRDRPTPDVGVEPAVQARAQNRDRLRRERFALQLEPFLGDALERIELCSATLLALHTRVDAIRDQPS